MEEKADSNIQELIQNYLDTNKKNSREFKKQLLKTNPYILAKHIFNMFQNKQKASKIPALLNCIILKLTRNPKKITNKIDKIHEKAIKYIFYSAAISSHIKECELILHGLFEKGSNFIMGLIGKDMNKRTRATAISRGLAFFGSNFSFLEYKSIFLKLIRSKHRNNKILACKCITEAIKSDKAHFTIHQPFFISCLSEMLSEMFIVDHVAESIMAFDNLDDFPSLYIQLRQAYEKTHSIKVLKAMSCFRNLDSSYILICLEKRSDFLLDHLIIIKNILDKTPVPVNVQIREYFIQSLSQIFNFVEQAYHNTYKHTDNHTIPFCKTYYDKIKYTLIPICTKMPSINMIDYFKDHCTILGLAFASMKNGELFTRGIFSYGHREEYYRLLEYHIENSQNVIIKNIKKLLSHLEQDQHDIFMKNLIFKTQGNASIGYCKALSYLTEYIPDKKNFGQILIQSLYAFGQTNEEYDVPKTTTTGSLAYSDETIDYPIIKTCMECSTSKDTYGSRNRKKDVDHVQWIIEKINILNNIYDLCKFTNHLELFNLLINLLRKKELNCPDVILNFLIKLTQNKNLDQKKNIIVAVNSLFDLMELYESKVVEKAIAIICNLSRGVGIIEILPLIRFDTKNKIVRNNLCTLLVKISEGHLYLIVPFLCVEYFVGDAGAKLTVLKVISQLADLKYEKLLVSIIENGLNNKDVFMRSQSLKAAKNIIEQTESIEIVYHLLNFIWFFILDENVTTEFDKCVTAIYSRCGLPYLMKYFVLGIYHPCQRVRKRYNTIIAMFCVNY